MKDTRSVREQIEDSNDEMLFADGFDDAILGVADRCGCPPLVVYDASKCIDILMQRDGMDLDDAHEYFTFNTLGAWVGPLTPLWLWPYPERRR